MNLGKRFFACRVRAAILVFSGLASTSLFRADLVLQQLHKTSASTPFLGLAQGADGNFYGIASQYVAPAPGSIFRLTPSGAYTTVYSFTSGGAAGSNPEGGLVLADDGKLYGTAGDGGLYGHGTVFRIATPGGLAPIISFDEPTGLHLLVSAVE